MFSKRLIRKQKKLLNNFNPISIVSHVIKLITELKPKIVGLYYPMDHEINILSLFQYLKNYKYALPKIISNEIIYCEYKGEITKGKFNIPVSKSNKSLIPDIILIPGIAFGLNGYRIGMGYGYYDRYIQSHPSVIKIGICNNKQLFSSVPFNDKDQKLDYIITDIKRYSISEK